MPHTGPNTIFQFRLDEKRPVHRAETGEVNTGENTGPRQFALSQTGWRTSTTNRVKIAAFDVDRKVDERFASGSARQNRISEKSMRESRSLRTAGSSTWPIAGTTVWPGLLLIQKQVRSEFDHTIETVLRVSTSTRPLSHAGRLRQTGLDRSRKRQQAFATYEVGERPVGAGGRPLAVEAGLETVAVAETKTRECLEGEHQADAEVVFAERWSRNRKRNALVTLEKSRYTL